MGTTLDDLGRHDEAIAAYQEAIRLNPTYATAYNNKGTTLGKLERYAEALCRLSMRRIRLNPTYASRLLQQKCDAGSLWDHSMRRWRPVKRRLNSPRKMLMAGN